MTIKIHTVFSGGQTGVDRAALDAAMHAGLRTGGWCPPGREADDGRIPDVYELKKTDLRNSAVLPEVPRSLRTEWNVRDSDATLILGPEECFGPGTKAMEIFCEMYGKQLFKIHDFSVRELDRLKRWLAIEEVEKINIGGPSERECEGIERDTYVFLQILFRNL